MEEKRIIKVSYQKAREWYNSNNSSLKEIALQAFSKEELEQVNIRDIILLLLTDPFNFNLNNVQISQLQSINNRKDFDKISAPKLLRIIAVYFNEGFWKKKEGEEGYFFYKKEHGFMSMSHRVLDKYWCIASHNSVCYPTLVYFKNEKDCKDAYNIMKNLGKLDSLYTDF